MHSRHPLLARLRWRPKARALLAVVAAANQLFVAGLAAAPSAPATLSTHLQAVCPRAQGTGHCSTATDDDALRLSLPDGAAQCPGSGDGAACLTSPSSIVQPGVASTPAGRGACPTDPGSAITAPAACIDTIHATTAQTTASETPPTVVPSVPISSLQPAAAMQPLNLRASHHATQSGQTVALTATAPDSVSGSGQAIEIFDMTTSTLVGLCSHGSECTVAYAARSGVHYFTAYLTSPTATAPSSAPATSNTLSVGWIDLKLVAVNTAVGPGKPVTVTATSSIPVEGLGYAIEIFDLGNMGRVTYCSRGTNCSVSLTQASSGTRSLVAAVGNLTSRYSNADIWAVSEHLPVTWLSISLGGTSTFQVGSTIYLSARANADVTNTPWSIGILDDKGFLVGPPCKRGAGCTAQVRSPSSGAPHFTAVIGAVPDWPSQTKLDQVLQRVSGPPSLVDIQARSAEIQPSRLLWGVDSCKAYTGDPSGKEVYATVSRTLGAPDFWGRYLTGTYYCPGLSWPEIYLAARARMGILPIYNDYDCSNVVGYDTGMGYALAATGVASHIGVTQGRVIAIDIEPPGAACPGAASVNSWFIRGWYDGAHQAGYVPVFYGNGTGGSEFANAWCEAQSEIPAISTTSYIWSFEPSLITGGWSKSRAPVWQPHLTGCPDYVAAWQYQIGSNGDNQDIDGDEALSLLPLWYPTVTGP